MMSSRRPARSSRKLGSTVKSTAKQVTGIGRGDIKLEVDVPKAPPGGTLRGRVVLQLAEPTEAKRLIVSLRAQRRQRQAGATNPVHVEMYKLDRELGGAQRYETTSLPFELTVPDDALELQADGLPSAARGGEDPRAERADRVAGRRAPRDSVGPRLHELGRRGLVSR